MISFHNFQSKFSTNCGSMNLRNLHNESYVAGAFTFSIFKSFTFFIYLCLRSNDFGSYNIQFNLC